MIDLTKVRKKSHAGQILYKQGVCQQDAGVVGGVEGVGEEGLVRGTPKL